MVDYNKEYENLTDTDHVFESIDFESLKDKVEGLYTGIVFLGGSWHKGCQALVPMMNLVAKQVGIDKIYNYDPKFTNIFGEVEDMRDCLSLEVKLQYYYLVEKIGYKSDERVQDTLIPKMHLPFIIAIKNGTVVGYMSEKYIFDTYLHRPGEKENVTKEVMQKIKDLYMMI